HVNRRTILGAPTLVIPTEGRNQLFYSSIVITSEFRRFICGVAGRVQGFAVFLTAYGWRLGGGFLPRKQSALSQHFFTQLALPPLAPKKPGNRGKHHPQAPGSLTL